MSAEYEIQFEVRSLGIMKDTLKEMNIQYNEIKAGILSIERPYHNIVINSNTGEVSYDQENQRELDQITQNYQVAWFKDNCIREGKQFREVVTAAGHVELYIDE